MHHIPKNILFYIDDMTNKDENTTESAQANIKQTTNKDSIPEVTTQK